MQDFGDVAVGEEVAEARQVELPQRVDDEVFAGNGDLDEADFVEVGVQRVGLGVDGDDAVPRDALQGAVELGLLVDPDHCWSGGRAQGTGDRWCSRDTWLLSPMEIIFRSYAPRSNSASDVNARTESS